MSKTKTTSKGKSIKSTVTDGAKHESTVKASRRRVIPQPDAVRTDMPRETVAGWPAASWYAGTPPEKRNAFTATISSVMASPQELVKATKQKASEEARRTQLERCNGFGGNTLKGLSKKAREQLAKAPRSITIEKAGGGIKRHAKTMASI